MESTQPCRQIAAEDAPAPSPPSLDEPKKFASESTLIERTSNESRGDDVTGLGDVSDGGGLGGGLGGGGLGGGLDGRLGDVCARASDASDARRTLCTTAVVLVVRARRPRERRARGDMRADDSRERPNDRDAAAKTSKCEDEDDARARVVRRGAREDGGVRRGRV